MAALKTTRLEAPMSAGVAAPAQAYPRHALDGETGGPNPALQAQFDRLAAFGAGVAEPDVVKFGPRLRLAIAVGAAVLPWVGIWLVVGAALAPR